MFKKVLFFTLMSLSQILAMDVTFEDKEIVDNPPSQLDFTIPIIGSVNLKLIVDPSNPNVIFRLSDIETKINAGPLVISKISGELKFSKGEEGAKAHGKLTLTSQGTLLGKKINLGIKELQQDLFKGKGENSFKMVKFGVDFVEKQTVDLFDSKQLTFESADFILEKTKPALLEVKAELATMPVVGKLTATKDYINFDISADKLQLSNLFEQLKQGNLSSLTLDEVHFTFNSPLADYQQPLKIEVSASADMSAVAAYFHKEGASWTNLSLKGSISNTEGLFLQGKLEGLSIPPVITSFKNASVTLKVPPVHKIVKETEGGFVVTQNNFSLSDVDVKNLVYKPVEVKTI